MGTIWIKEVTGGLDTRRMRETTSGGVLIAAVDGHITRGGEFEKRAAFVLTETLPAGTFGLSATSTSRYVFGSDPLPAGLPSGVLYQRLQHPDGLTALASVLSTELFAGKLYVVAEFEDGSRQHFYDGVLVDAWYDGRARATFRVTGGGTTAATSATGSFEITGGSLGGGNQITSITINSVSLMAGAVAHTGNNATTADAVATAINSNVSVPDYTATTVGQTVIITAVTTGTAINGKSVIATPGGTATIGNATNMTGGADAVTSSISDIKVNGVAVASGSVLWTTSNSATATAVAAAINSYSSTPEYTATASDDQVNIVSATAGSGPNGFAVSAAVSDGFTISPASGIVLSGGADSIGFTPGTFIKTVGSKLYSPSGPNLHFSGIQRPTAWTSDATGAGFIDMSSQASGSETLTAVARYQQYLAVFAEQVIQIWFVDPDPTLNRQTQVLDNTGTASPRSVTKFGDSDLFYLNESGLRSLRARDASNAAATTDIGVPVDSLVIDALRNLTTTERSRIIGLIEPQDGRFWLIIKGTIFVFSYFSGVKVSAWTTYAPSADLVPFDIDDAVVFGRKVYVRSGDKIYVYGGLDTALTYDATEATAQLPYLDADAPAQEKRWNGIDAAVIGTWELSAAMDPTDLAASDKVATVAKSTFGEGTIELKGSSTHFSLILRSVGDGYAKFGSALIHFDKSADAD